MYYFSIKQYNGFCVVQNKWGYKKPKRLHGYKISLEK